MSSFVGAFLMFSLDSDLQYPQLQPFLFFCLTFLLYLSLFVEDWKIMSSSFAGAFRMHSLEDSDLQCSKLQPLLFFCRTFCALPLSVRRGLVSDLQCSQLQPFLFFLVGLFCFTSLFSSGTDRSLLLLRELSGFFPWTVVCNVHSCNRYFSSFGLFCFTSLSFRRGLVDRFFFCESFPDVFPGQWFGTIHSCNRSFSFWSDYFALPVSFRRGLVDRFFFCGSFPDVFPGQWFAMFTVATVPFLLSDCFA